MSEYVKLKCTNPETDIFIRKRQVSAVMVNGYTEGQVCVCMMGGGIYDIETPIDEVIQLLGLDSEV